jgi:hypothetical protein
MSHNFHRQGGDAMDMPRRVSLLFTFVLTVVLLTGSSYAIPAFSRQYGTSCTTCHVDFPKLNDFGKAFKDAGFKFPKGDEDFIKVPQVMLGAPAQKELWPHTVFPGTIPGLPPIGLRFNQFFQHTSGNANNYYAGQNSGAPPGTVLPSTIPHTDFQPGYFSIFTAGNFGSDIAFWVDDDISVAGKNLNGSLGDAYLRFVNVGRFFKLPTDSLTLKVGQFELDLPFTQAKAYDISPYDIYSQANIGAGNSAFPPGVSNVTNLAGPGRGIELSGGHHYGGYHYAIAVVDQNTSNAPAANPNVPSATGVGFVSDSNFKDLYGRFAYRFNLERDPASRHDVQAAGATGPRDHTYLTLGSYYFYGRSATHVQGTSAILTAREPFYRVGGDFDFNYRQFNLYGLFMYGHDNSLLWNGGNGFVPGTSAKFDGGFLQADYLALPWMMTILRYDRVQSTTDFLNPSGGNFFMPVGSTRDRVTPGVQFLIHANVKASFEYAIRPRQTLSYDPTTGKAVNPFRTNTATGALEFVY